MGGVREEDEAGIEVKISIYMHHFRLQSRGAILGKENISKRSS